MTCPVGARQRGRRRAIRHTGRRFSIRRNVGGGTDERDEDESRDRDERDKDGVPITDALGSETGKLVSTRKQITLEYGGGESHLKTEDLAAVGGAGDTVLPPYGDLEGTVFGQGAKLVEEGRVGVD